MVDQRILYVDEDPQIGSIVLSQLGIDFRKEFPGSLRTRDQIRSALEGVDLVLMDYDLIEGNDELAPPFDGLELMQRIRSVCNSKESSQDQKIPFMALFTNRFEEIIATHECNSRLPSLVSRDLNVDWVFFKTRTDDPLTAASNLTDHRVKEILSVLDMNFLALDLPSAKETALLDLLGLLQSETWCLAAFATIVDAGLPKYEVFERNNIVALVKWLIQVGLPFEGCLTSLPAIALRFELAPAEFTKTVLESSTSKFVTSMDRFRYSGKFASFYPNRYWRLGISDFLFSYTKGESPSNSEIRNRIFEDLGHALPALDCTNSCLKSDPDSFHLSEQTAPFSSLFQVEPRNWPSGIEYPWIDVEVLKHNGGLRSLIISDDIERFNATAFQSNED